jgi:uncharacterized membrane protein YuzA (DUF378 family)
MIFPLRTTPIFRCAFFYHSKKLRILYSRFAHTVLDGVFCREQSAPFQARPKERNMVTIMILDRIALILTIIGALNWGSIGLFQFDIVAWICGGQSALISRIIYTVVALAGVWCISLLFRERDQYGELTE